MCCLISSQSGILSQAWPHNAQRYSDRTGHVVLSLPFENCKWNIPWKKHTFSMSLNREQSWLCLNLLLLGFVSSHVFPLQFQKMASKLLNHLHYRVNYPFNKIVLRVKWMCVSICPVCISIGVFLQKGPPNGPRHLLFRGAALFPLRALPHAQEPLQVCIRVTLHQ